MREYWTNFVSLLHEYLGISTPVIFHLAWSVLVVFACIGAKIIIGRYIKGHFADPAKRYKAGKTTSYFLGFFAFFMLILIWMGHGKGILTYFGLVSAGLAVALKDPLVNIAGWLFIIIRKPVNMGDRIEIAGIAGDVIDIRLFQFSIIEIGNWVHADQSTGRIIHIPNGLVFKNPTANFTQGFNFIWNEAAITITFESNWVKAKNVLQYIADANNPLGSKEAEEQVREASQKYLIFYKHLTPIVWTRVASNGVELTIRYLCEARKRRSSESKIWESILTEFAKTPDITIAYPTQRLFFRPQEGKPDSDKM